MNYSPTYDYVIIRRQLKGGWSSFNYVPKKQTLIIRQGTIGNCAVYIFPTNNEMYRNTCQISYPKG